MKIIEEIFKNEFQETLLVNNEIEKFIIKKYKKINKNVYQKAKLQFFDLQRFSALCDHISPKVLEENETDTDYSFSIEYLDGYKNLFNLNLKQQEIALKIAIGKLNEIYLVSKFIDPIYFFEKTISNINYKIEIYKNKYKKIENLLYSKNLNINNRNYFGLTSVLSKVNPAFFAPKRISQIHGNLSFSHILFDNKDLKLISPCCMNLYDAPEKDLGRMATDLICKRYSWLEIHNPIKQFDNESIHIEEIEENLDIFNSLKINWSTVLRKEEILEVAIFYMCLDLIENASEYSKINEDYFYYSILNAIIYLNKLI